MIYHEPTAGTHISATCREAAALAALRDEAVSFQFNRITVVVRPGDTPEAAEACWHEENERRSQAYRDSPEGRRDAAEAEARRRRHQDHTDALVTRLPGVLNDPAALVRWCVELSDAADHIDIRWEPAAVADTIVAAGYAENAHVGRPPETFSDRRVTGEYLIGQAVNCLRRGLPPHPVIKKFAAEAGFIQGQA